jgi:hypothetical protein
VKRADPELCLRLTADVTDAPIHLEGPLEQCELLGWGDVDTGLRRAHRSAEEPSVQDSTASHSQIGLNPIQKQLSLSKGIGLSAEHRTVTQQPCLLKAAIRPGLAGSFVITRVAGQELIRVHWMGDGVRPV